MGDVALVVLSVLPARPFNSELVVRALRQNLRVVPFCSRLAGRLNSGPDRLFPRPEGAAMIAFVNDPPRVLVTDDEMLSSCHWRPRAKQSSCFNDAPPERIAG